MTWKQLSAFSQIATRNGNAKRFIISTGNLVLLYKQLKV